MDIPESMKAELAGWNSGKGISLEMWIGCTGNFAQAVGYCSVFWPEFVEFEGYILRRGFAETSLRSFEDRDGNDRKGVECVMNHLHIADLQYVGCEDLSRDKIIVLGRVLKEIYEAKLKYQFPDRPCVVEFYTPEDEDDLWQYQIYFWQRCHESESA